ncbi:hypothetical protein GCM10011519_15610 [Marmoricola endophyticus]|uniref:Glycosyltransferase n=1 Tax=Marmoricola endophyticus TaxID=2040280 RepID=A0A917BHF5_9ACTN|nr:glycosyltransferase [Marmoricola endophyticus]GGF42615.1 hypothetical protein GCM10011519_15610 [Marmoricola endophyticus]
MAQSSPFRDNPARRLAGRVVRRLRREAAAPAPAPDADTVLLLDTALFDHEWYALLAGEDLTREQAVASYLGGGWRRHAPHPLFDPEVARRSLELTEDGDDRRDPLRVYLRRRDWEARTHPLFDAGRHLERHPEASEHPEGPLGHFLAMPPARRASEVDWLADVPLDEWLREDATQWSARKAQALPMWSRTAPPSEARADLPASGGDPGRTTVVLLAEHGDHRLARSVTSVLEQTEQDWELLVVPMRDVPALEEYDVPDDPRIRVLPEQPHDRWAARNTAVEEASGTHVAWLVEGDRWLPGRLRSVRGAVAAGARWVHDAARDDKPGAVRRFATRSTSPERLRLGLAPDLGTQVVATDLFRSVGGFDTSRVTGFELDLALRLADELGGAPAYLDRLGVIAIRRNPRDRRRGRGNARPWLAHESLASGADTVLNEVLVDWAELAARAVDPSTVSVIIPTNHDWEMTRLAVQRVVEARDLARESGGPVSVQVVLVDNGAPVTTSAVLASLALSYDDVDVVRAGINHGFALGNNVGLVAARGGTVVFLNNDTEVRPGWLEPVLEQLQDPDVLGVQSLLVYPTGAVQSAGVVFPPGGGIPHPLLQGFPVEDAVGMDADPLHALTGAALVMRWPDVVDLRGFDPIFRNGMEDVDICLRLEERRPGRFVVCPDSVVVHHESRSPGRFLRSVANRFVLMDRWSGRLPEDDVEAWARRGYAVLGHEIRSVVDPDQRVCVAEPVLVPTRLLERRVASLTGVSEPAPRLRWALKNPAPAGPEGDAWGDTHFLEVLADALRALGQEVVVDRRGEMGRRTGWTDDVVLLLRGLAPHGPKPDQVNLQWIISHPDMVELGYQHGWDRIYVASPTFAERMAALGLPAVPLLQATEPSRFTPDAGVPDTGPRALFVGSHRKKGRPLIMAAVEEDLPLSIIGAKWEGVVPDRFLAAPYLANDRLAAAYRSAGVVLNDHWHDMAEQGFLSNRLFDAVAAGARVVSDPVPGLEDVFGDAVQVAHTPAELRELVTAPDLDAVFGTDEVRRQRAAWVAENHSFAARARVLLDDALAVRAGRTGAQR